LVRVAALFPNWTGTDKFSRLGISTAALAFMR
jgi:hypothetical protein